MNTVFVTGATGLIGQNLVIRLRNEGKTVVAHSRGSSDVTFLERLGVPVVRCEITDDEAIRRALRGISCIVHLAGAVSATAPFLINDRKSQLLYHQVNIELTRRLLNAALVQRVRRFVYCSSVAVYAQAPGCPISEDAPTRPLSDYGISKRRAEILVGTAAAAGLETVIVRPCIVVGAGDRHVGPMLRALASLPLLIVPGGGSRRIDLADVDDVTDVLSRCITQNVAIGRIYNATSGSPLTLSDIAEVLSERLRLGPIIPVPHFAFRWGSLALRPFARGLMPEMAPLLSRTATDYLKGDLVFDISRARRELAFNPAGRVQSAILKAFDKDEV